MKSSVDYLESLRPDNIAAVSKAATVVPTIPRVAAVIRYRQDLLDKEMVAAPENLMNHQQIGALPASTEESNTTVKLAKDAPSMSTQYKILVIEDNPVLQDSIAVWLYFAGYTVVVANDGFEGLAELSKELPDLIITDIAMPGLNGIEMIRSVRQFPCRLSRVPILVLTGSFSEYASEALSAGADRALAKPTDPRIILAQVETLLKESPAAFRAAS